MTHLSFEHTYKATWKSGDREYTITAPFWFQVFLGEKPRVDFNNLPTSELTFSANDLEHIHRTFNTQRIDFAKKLINMKPFIGPAVLFSSDRYVERDLFLLLGLSADPELTQALDALRKTHPSQAKNEEHFQELCALHSQSIINFTQNIAQRPAFQSMMDRLYLSIALDYKIKQSHWLYNKETYAYLSSIVLKIPVAFVQFAVWVVTFTGLLLFWVTPVILAGALLTTLPVVAPWIALLAFTLAIITSLIGSFALMHTTLKYIEFIFKTVDHPFLCASYWIDYAVGALFGVQFFAFELSELLAKMNHPIESYSIAIAQPAPESDTSLASATIASFFQPGEVEVVIASYETPTPGAFVDVMDEYSDDECGSVLSID